MEDKVAVHGPCLRIFILWIQGDEQGQAGADSLRYIPHRPHAPQPFLEKLGAGKVRCMEQSIQISFRLGADKIGQNLLRNPVEYVWVMCQHPLSQGITGNSPQPTACPEKVFQDVRQVLAVTSLLQS